jgi:hypothetical protein
MERRKNKDTRDQVLKMFMKIFRRPKIGDTKTLLYECFSVFKNRLKKQKTKLIQLGLLFP